MARLISIMWHWKLLPVLPTKLLENLWHDVCGLAGKRDYYKQLDDYARLIIEELLKRQIPCNYKNYTMRRGLVNGYEFYKQEPKYQNPFPDIHDNDYLRRNLYRLEDYHELGKITDDEWDRIKSEVNKVLWANGGE